MLDFEQCLDYFKQIMFVTLHNVLKYPKKRDLTTTPDLSMARCSSS